MQDEHGSTTESVVLILDLCLQRSQSATRELIEKAASPPGETDNTETA